MCGRFYFQFKQDSVSLYLQDLVQKNHLVEFASDEIFSFSGSVSFASK